METNKQYDEIVRTIMQNVVNQSTYTDGKVVLWDFQQNCDADKLYYNVACIVADLFNEQIYIQMPFFQFLKLKYKQRKRKNIHWIDRKTNKINAMGKTSVYIIMNYIKDYYQIDEQKFADINNEYYGWY